MSTATSTFDAVDYPAEQDSWGKVYGYKWVGEQVSCKKVEIGQNTTETGRLRFSLVSGGTDTTGWGYGASTQTMFDITSDYESDTGAGLLSFRAFDSDGSTYTDMITMRPGSMTLNGDLTITGDSTVIETSEVVTSDMSITIGNGETTMASLDGAGIYMGSDTLSGRPYIIYEHDETSGIGNIVTNVGFSSSDFSISGDLEIGVITITQEGVGTGFASLTSENLVASTDVTSPVFVTDGGTYSLSEDGLYGGNLVADNFMFSDADSHWYTTRLYGSTSVTSPEFVIYDGAGTMDSDGLAFSNYQYTSSSGMQYGSVDETSVYYDSTNSVWAIRDSLIIGEGAGSGPKLTTSDVTLGDVEITTSQLGVGANAYVKSTGFEVGTMVYQETGLSYNSGVAEIEATDGTWNITGNVTINTSGVLTADYFGSTNMTTEVGNDGVVVGNHTLASTGIQLSDAGQTTQTTIDENGISTNVYSVDYTNGFVAGSAVTITEEAGVLCTDSVTASVIQIDGESMIAQNSEVTNTTEIKETGVEIISTESTETTNVSASGLVATNSTSGDTTTIVPESVTTTTVYADNIGVGTVVDIKTDGIYIMDGETEVVSITTAGLSSSSSTFSDSVINVNAINVASSVLEADSTGVVIGTDTTDSSLSIYGSVEMMSTDGTITIGDMTLSQTGMTVGTSDTDSAVGISLTEDGVSVEGMSFQRVSSGTIVAELGDAGVLDENTENVYTVLALPKDGILSMGDGNWRIVYDDDSEALTFQKYDSTGATWTTKLLLQ
jgi:hypothetical protein